MSFETELLEWMHKHSEPGGPFRNSTHAVEAACRRLRDEQAFIQHECTSHGAAYNPAAFWNLFRDLIQQYSPNRRGRVWHPENRTERALTWFNFDAALQKWVDKQCKGDGTFENPSHLIETGLRHLRRVEPAHRPVAFTGFPFDEQATWQNYKRELAALNSSGAKP